MRTFLRRNKEEIIVSFIFLFFAFGFNVYRVQGDGVQYYAFLEYMLRPLLGAGCHPEGLSNPGFQQAGCAFLNAPFYYVAYLIESIFQRSWNFNGITLRTIAVNIASNFYVCTALIIAVKILKLLRFKHIVLPIISIVFSTAVFTASAITPSWNHASDIFITTLLLFLFLRCVKTDEKPYLLLGLFSVVAILVRYVNCVLILPIAIYFIMIKDYKGLKKFLIGLLVSGWIIPCCFLIYNGSPLSPFSGDSVERIASAMPMFPVFVLKYLIHPLHGLFIWSPATILSLTGLLIVSQEQRKLSLVFLGMFFLFLFFYGYMHFWYAGWSFSNRYLVNLFPVFVIGLASCLDRFQKSALLLTLIFTAYSIFLFFNWYLCIFHPEFENPGAMIYAWGAGLPTNDACLLEKVTPGTFFQRIWEVCRYKYLFKLFT